MNYPKILFVDASGRPLPRDKDGVPFVVQFKARWAIKLDSSWTGGVAVVGNPYQAFHRQKDNLWYPPKNLGGDIVRRSGEVTAVLIDKQNIVIQDASEAVLRVRPANISDEQMDTMVSDIGIMVLTTACCVSRAIPIPLGERAGVNNLGRQWIAGSGMLTTATALLDLATTVKNVWPELEKRPLKSFVAQPGLVDIAKAPFSSHTLVQRLINPSKRRIRSIERTESAVCQENEFLCYVLDKYLQILAGALIKSLNAFTIEPISDRFVPSTQKRKDEAFQKFVERSRSNIRTTNIQGRLLQQKISDAIGRLNECQQWAKLARQSHFLQGVTTPHTPRLNSLRLTESLTYGLIYSKFVQVKGDALDSIQEVSSLIESISQGNVKPTWEIYEIWCLVKLYSSLIMYTPLRPISGESGLFQSLFIAKDGAIQVPKDKRFQLKSDVDQNALFSVSFTYEPQLRNLDGKPRTPDITIEIETGGYKKSYCFDAKYRCYAQQGSKKFIEDVIGTAKEKYKEGLSTSASFILHSDAEIDYWGEVPFNDFLSQTLNEQSEVSDWVGHRYGAISLVPNNYEDTQLKKIIKLLLQYHSAQLSTTCITCGYQLAIGRDAFTSWKPNKISERELAKRVVENSGGTGNGTGIYCSCPQCGEFWVVQSCFGSHHRLLKFKDCFHKASAHPEFKGKWMYQCPECGSDPSPFDLSHNRRELPSQIGKRSYLEETF